MASNTDLKEVEVVTKHPSEDNNQNNSDSHIQSKNGKQKSGPQVIAAGQKSNRFHNRVVNNDDEEAKRQKQLEEEKKKLFDDDEIKSPFPQLEKFLENTWFQIFVTIITVYALFGDDIRVLTTTKSADLYFDIVTMVSMATFLLEMGLAMLSKISYTCSFYFWLDLISTVSLILDIQMIASNIFYSGGSAQLAQAGKASRVGTKTGRVVRLVRLIRIVKLYKASQDAKEKRQNLAKQKFAEKRKKKKQKNQIYPNGQQEDDHSSQQKNEEKKPFCPCLKKNKNGKDGKDNKDGNENGANKPNTAQIQRDPKTRKLSVLRKSIPNAQHGAGQGGEGGEGGPPGGGQKIKEQQIRKKEEQKESRVSQVLSSKTTKRVIIIVLTLLLVMPLFSAEYWNDFPNAMEFHTNLLREWSIHPGTTVEQLVQFNELNINRHKDTDNFIAQIKAPFEELKYEVGDFDELREDEKSSGVAVIEAADYEKSHPNETEFIAKLKSMSEEDRQFLGIMSIREANRFAATLSLGRTVFVCFVLTCGALYFSKDANDLALGPIERMIVKLTRISRNPIIARDEVQMQDDAEENETKLIENAIVKISSLLALGFGEAGSKIIGTNISQGGDVDPMLPGHKLLAIYGFCDIRQFTDTTEVLQEEIMIFVNNIGEIVHSYTDRYQGAANKNIGDAFLLVWRIQEDKYEILQDNEIKYKDQKYISILCDMALVSFMRIQSKLNREPKILNYRNHPKLNKRMPNYKVKMGFGLHLGWGIEGAIGSEYKIDASYLSPNVNMASRLEAATKQYGVPLLVSSSLQEQCTPQMKRYTRYIDRVMVKGAGLPIGLYTVDMAVDDIPASKDPLTSYEENEEERKEFLTQKKLELTNQLNYWDGEQDEDYEPWNAEDQITMRKDLRLMMEDWDERFQNIFAEGFYMYIRGNWKAATSKFQYIIRAENPDDGPTKNLLNFMSATNYVAPMDWPGYRELKD